MAVLGTGIVLSGAILYIHRGGLDVGADQPHWALTTSFLEGVRDQSVRWQAAELVVPDLTDPQRISVGATHYAEMCSECHLAPGGTDGELRAGLYPTPPNLTIRPVAAPTHRGARTPAEQFWIIKHGIKMSGMPAWGKSHDDAAIWSLVAFLQVLPTLDALQYRDMTEPGAGPDHRQGHHASASGSLRDGEHCVE